MFVVVYGTLKRGYGNNRLLQTSNFVSECIVPGYLLRNAGFPVAFPDQDSSLKGELWDIGDDLSTLSNLDRLESNGRMYQRTLVEAIHPAENPLREIMAAEMYVGVHEFWNRLGDEQLPLCPVVNGYYKWSREY
jgi:gamma-glutamylcyclotransferase (GGCT)/AIG2-like uncharacterized protein YtfP